MLFDPAKLSSEGLVGDAETVKRDHHDGYPLILGGLAIAAFRAGLVSTSVPRGRSSSDRSSRPHRFRVPALVHPPSVRRAQGFRRRGHLGGIASFLKSQDQGSRSHHDDHATGSPSTWSRGC